MPQSLDTKATSSHGQSRDILPLRVETTTLPFGSVHLGQPRKADRSSEAEKQHFPPANRRHASRLAVAKGEGRNRHRGENLVLEGEVVYLKTLYKHSTSSVAMDRFPFVGFIPTRNRKKNYYVPYMYLRKDSMGPEPAEAVQVSDQTVNQGDWVRIRYGTKAVISTSEYVLLIKEQHSDGSSFWTLPGGGIKSDESLPECLARELLEELQCQCLIGETITTIWYAHSNHQSTFSTYTVFECSLLSMPIPNEDEGILEYQWVSPTNLPPSTLSPIRHLLQKNIVL